MKQIALLIALLPLFLFSQDILEEEIHLENGEIELPGILSIPETHIKIPLAIFIHGSGNIDRNGNQAGVGIKANYIKTLADSLNNRGIAFYRYDKRTATLSNINKLGDITLHEFVADAKIAIDHFKKDPRFSALFLIGHSQGSLVGMLSITPKINGFISIAGPGQSIDKTMVEQLNNQNPDLAKLAGEHLYELRTTDTIVSVHPFLMQLFAPQNQKFLKSWMVLSPEEEIKKITVPMLLLNGEEDLQVTGKDFMKLKEAQPNAKGELIPHMNHVLKDVYSIAENQNSYFQENFPLSSRLVDLITEFINP
ncbi:alpha/beta hydrolase [Flavobacteriaceae bacterium KMM 6897]|nr:alpha/beta hydrolase [Flavobacteriaceae bacterium KMM 6897]